MKRLVNFIEQTVAGFIGIMIIPGLVIVGVLLYIVFGPKFDIS